MKTNFLQQKMFSDQEDKSLFRKAEMMGFEYMANASTRHIFPLEEDLQKLKIFEEPLSKEVSSAHEILDLLNKFGSPATVNQVGGRYFGFVNGGIIPIGLAVKNLTSYWDQNSAMQVLSPISSKLEVVVQNWLVDLLGLPKQTVAGFVSGSAMANFCGLAAGRYKILEKQGWDLSEKGLFGAPPIRVVTCRQAHSTILKTVSLLGLGKANIEWVEVDDQGRMLVDDLPELDDKTILILQAGNVNSGAFDDLQTICKIAQAKNAWIHIDGAFGLWAAATARLKYLSKGIELANSWSVDGHKTLNTPYDSGIVLCSDPNALKNALHMSGAYIIDGDERDGMYFTPEMSRRSRIIELWAVMKYLGVEGIDVMINGLNERAQLFAKLLESLNGFEVLNEVVFNQVLVRCVSDEITDSVIQEIQAMRECWVGGSSWKGRKVIRVSVCSWATTEEDILIAANSFKEALEKVEKKNA